MIGRETESSPLGPPQMFSGTTLNESTLDLSILARLDPSSRKAEISQCHLQGIQRAWRTNVAESISHRISSGPVATSSNLSIPSYALIKTLSSDPH